LRARNNFKEIVGD